jgi:hypothetical protein
MATLGDTFRVYIKPSLDGQLVIRKKTSNQTSARLKARQAQFASVAPSKPCHDELVSAGKCRDVKGKMTCHIKDMKACMRRRLGGS